MKGYRIVDAFKTAGLDPEPYIHMIRSMLDTHNEADIYRIVYKRMKRNGWK